MSDNPSPTRFVLVDETGRIYDRTGVFIDHDLQDDGQTLKVFITPLPRDQADNLKADHLAALREDSARPNLLSGEPRRFTLRQWGDDPHT